MRTMLFGRSGVADAKAATCRRADASSQNGTNAHSRPILHALGLGSWLATMLLYSNTVTPFQRYAGTQLFVGDFALQSLAFACLLSLTIAIVSWRGNEFQMPSFSSAVRYTCWVAWRSHIWRHAPVIGLAALLFG